MALSFSEGAEMNRPRDSFLEAMRSAGLFPNDIVPDNCFHRFDIKKKGDKAGWYILSNEPPCGTFGNWQTGMQTTWKPDNYKTLSDDEKREYRQKIEEHRAQAQENQKRLHERAAKRAQRCLTGASPASPGNQYLNSKGFTRPDSLAGLRQSRDSLFVPVLDRSGKVQSLQIIRPDGTKRFLAGGKVAGGFFPIKSTSTEGVIYICEGLATSLSIHEVTGSTVVCAFNAGNLQAVAEMVRDSKPNFQIVIAGDNDHQTEGNPGRKKAEEAAETVKGICIIPDTLDDVSDFNDLHILHGKDAVLKKLVLAMEKNECPEARSVSLSERVEELAQLTPLEYEQIRERTASELGVRVTALDKEVKQARPKADSLGGFFEEVTPWEEAVDSRELALELFRTFERFSILPKGSAVAASLWTVLTYCYDNWMTLPLLGILSPEKRCGKSTFMTILDCLCFNALSASNISPAAIFRVIEAHRPCLLIDEGDTFLRENEELRGVINSGHTLTQAYVVRCDGDNNEPTKFTTWAPKAIAMIGRLPDTIEDRAIVVPLKRKLPSEHCERHTRETREELAILRRKILRFVEDNSLALRSAKPERLQTANDRQADNWEPLLAIAEVAEVDKEARAAALCFIDTQETEQPIGVQLLQDIQEVFSESTEDKIFSDKLVNGLVAMEDRPWCEWRRGQPMTSSSLSKLLSPFSIRSKLLRIGQNVRRGYEKRAFHDAFGRYIPPPDVTALQPADTKACRDIQAVTKDQSVASANLCNASAEEDCNTVTQNNPSPEEKMYQQTHNQLSLFSLESQGLLNI